MEKLAMIKKYQEATSKKNDLDKDMFKTETIWLAVVIKFKTTIKYVPTSLPAHPNPSYDISDIDTNKEYLKEMLGRTSVRTLSKH